MGENLLLTKHFQVYSFGCSYFCAPILLSETLLLLHLIILKPLGKIIGSICILSFSRQFYSVFYVYSYINIKLFWRLYFCFKFEMKKHEPFMVIFWDYFVYTCQFWFYVNFWIHVYSFWKPASGLRYSACLSFLKLLLWVPPKHCNSWSKKVFDFWWKIFNLCITLGNNDT